MGAAAKATILFSATMLAAAWQAPRGRCRAKFWRMKEAPKTVEVNGKAFGRPVSKHEVFWQRRAQRHSGVADLRVPHLQRLRVRPLVFPAGLTGAR